MKRSANGLKPFLVGLLLLIPALAYADKRIEARRHFRTGMALIASGDYETGVIELKEAYAIRPHPNVLYNIARAYLDAGRVPEALEYYKKYLAENPPDIESVRSTVARLEESVAAQEPKVARAPDVTPARPPPSSTTLGGGTTVDPESVKRMAALMDRLESALAKAESLGASGPSPASAASDGAPSKGGATSAGESGEELNVGTAAPYEEQVVTASRRAQSTLEAPNATTIITAEEIRASGATSLVDLLRRVPGADVMRMGVGSDNVSLRGFNQRLANKVLVLLDGRTEYQDFLGLTVWSAIPVGLEEIERIEVIRGPGSALYGANAMLGVINIITKAPGTGPRAEVNMLAGSGQVAKGSVVAANVEKNFRYRFSAGYEQSDKWSRDYADDRSDIHPNVENTSLALRSGRANATALYTFNPDYQVGASAGVNRVYTELYPLGLLRNFFFDGTTAYAKTDFSLGPVKLKLFWNHLDAKAGPQYSAFGERSLITNLESNVFNAEAMYSHEFNLLGLHRVGVGAEVRLKRVDWTYTNGLRSELHAAAFIQDEWKIVESFRVLASYRVDRHPLLTPPYEQSPRISVVWIPVEGHALRAGFSTAFREPTFLESYVDIRVPVPKVTGSNARTVGNLELKPEYLTAFELGYRGDFPTLGLEWDVAAYQNEVRDLIGLSSFVRAPAPDTFDPFSDTYLLGVSNFQNESPTYTARGIEVGAKWSPIDGLDVRASGAVQNITSNSSEVCGPCSQAPALKLFGGVIYRSKANLDFSVDAAYVSATTWIEREPDAADPTRIVVAPYPLDPYTVINARVGYRFLDDHATVAIQGTDLGPTHAEHPFGNRIERRFFASLTVTP